MSNRNPEFNAPLDWQEQYVKIAELLMKRQDEYVKIADLLMEQNKRISELEEHVRILEKWQRQEAEWEQRSLQHQIDAANLLDRETPL